VHPPLAAVGIQDMFSSHSYPYQCSTPSITDWTEKVTGEAKESSVASRIFRTFLSKPFIIIAFSIVSALL
jgi:hypothetical protein